MEVSCAWSLIIITVLRICRVHALLPIPIISLEDKIEINEETKVTCMLPSSDCQRLEVELRIVTDEKLKDCVAYKGNLPNITCTLEVTKEMHELEIYCEAQFRTKSKPQKLNIQTDPEFTDCPDKLDWVEGEENSFHCKAKGFPPPTVVCVKNSVAYAEGEKFTALKNMSGDFNCSATNFHEVSKIVTVSVQYKPHTYRIRVEPSDFVMEGNDLTLICEVDAVPPPAYSWLTTADHALQDNHNRTLHINDVKKEHEGFYFCFVQNKHGVQTLTQKITILETAIVAESDVNKLSKGNGAEKTGPAYCQLLTVLISSSLYYLF